MFNDEFDKWQLRIGPNTGDPEFNRVCYILVEHDVIYEEIDDQFENYPFIRRAIYIKGEYDLDNQGRPLKLPNRWKLLDYDPEEEEEYLRSNNFTVVAWRYLGEKEQTIVVKF